MGSLSFLVIKGPAHILLGTVSFPRAAKTLEVGGGVGHKNAFKNAPIKVIANLISETFVLMH